MTEQEERVRRLCAALGEDIEGSKLGPCEGQCHHGDCRMSKAVTSMLDVPIAPGDKRAKYHREMIVEAAYKQLCWETREDAP